MIQWMTYAVDVVLLIFVVREIHGFASRYRLLKHELAQGDREARLRLYRRVLRFQWVSAALALTALRFDWNALRPDSLSLDSVPFVSAFLSGGGLRDGALTGIGMGVGLGTLGLILLRLRTRRSRDPRGVTATSPVARWRRLLPDFTAVLPVTARERWMWLAVSISAGICEEIVFRGWLLSVLHAPVGLTGTALIVAASVGFGLAHLYQGPGGVLLTGFAGVLFCALYVASGGLLVPILLHIAVDARFALLPAGSEGRTRSPQGGLHAAESAV